jgi:2-methylisocitrate lyase-like PEP mutase family enzyme
MSRRDELRRRFREFHHDPPVEPTRGILVMPNPWDVGSAKLLAELGAAALATTSAGFAGSLGRMDQRVTRDEMIEHARLMSAAVDVPMNVDSEDCYADSPDGVAATVALLAATDAAGCSIEDYDPSAGRIRDLDEAVRRVDAAVRAADGMVITARAENHLYGINDLDDTVARLVAYRDAGADVVYAPGFSSRDDVRRIVDTVGTPVNVLGIPGTPPIPELADLGVARVSTGSLLAWTAYGALTRAATELFGPGSTDYAQFALSGRIRDAAFG